MTPVAEHSLLHGRMVYPHRPALAVAIVSVVVLSGCGGSGRAAHAGSGGGTSLSAAVVAFVAPRDGADAVIGGQLADFAQKVQTKLLGECMTDDGFSAPAFGAGGPPNDLGNPQFPNLPAIEASHDLGLFVGGGVPFFGQQSGMSAPERRAWQARIMHCFRSTQRKTPLFGSAKFAQLNSGWFNVVNQVGRSAQIRALSKKAATCSAAHGVAATSVMSLYGRLQGQIGPLSSSSADSAKVQAVQAKGARVLAACWAKVINETTALLNGRRAAFLAQNANALSALESQVNTQVASLERQYGIKLAVGVS
ncbi:MAG TPA: hypothetical protein VJ741_06815 [Solirubrobacteraceae bacterium]|nr:hypothetical protein [Solirubrobacteraceae bacterium]